MKQNSMVVIYDIRGKLMYRDLLPGNKTIDISHLPDGWYLVADERNRYKIIKSTL
jgi:hypothetical protein